MNADYNIHMRYRLTHVRGLSEQGSAQVANQDRWGHVDDAVWVIDGATNLDKISVSPCGDDGEWIASALNDFLLGVKWSDYASIADVVREAIIALRRQYMTWLDLAANKPSTRPSAAIAIVRRVGNSGLEYFVLGDCSITILDPIAKTDQYFTNEDIMALDAAAISELAGLMKSGLSFSEARQGISDTLTKNRNLMNTPGGYWVVSLDPEVPKHATQGKIENVRRLEIMLASDGFSRFWDLFKISEQGWESYAAAKTDGLHRTLDRLRKTERADADMNQYPRFKISDDASVAICRFGQ
jgi:hypothetical protein